VSGEPRLLLLGAHLFPEDADVSGVTAFEAGGIVASAIEYDPDRPLAEPALIESAARARARLIEREIFVGVRYGATFRTREEVAAKIGSRAPGWRRLLEENRGKVELTLKIAGRGALRPAPEGVSSGADYLKQLHRLRRSEVDPAFRAAAEEEIAREAVAARWSDRHDGAVELALLVPRSEIARFRERGEALKSRFPSVAFLLSGPWPLEAFADE
jgi:hypothetical protein